MLSFQVNRYCCLHGKINYEVQPGLGINTSAVEHAQRPTNTHRMSFISHSQHIMLVACNVPQILKLQSFHHFFTIFVSNNFQTVLILSPMTLTAHDNTQSLHAFCMIVLIA